MRRRTTDILNYNFFDFFNGIKTKPHKVGLLSTCMNLNDLVSSAFSLTDAALPLSVSHMLKKPNS
uniref:Putative ovule protein n=1 Tax=Solanum chacoense TaxID=4108 RepID=A0A0V0H2V4_SOLCH